VTSDPVPCAGSPLLTGSRRTRSFAFWSGSAPFSFVEAVCSGSRFLAFAFSGSLRRCVALEAGPASGLLAWSAGPVRPFCSSSIRPRGAYRRRPPPTRRARCPQIASGASTPGSLTFRASSVGLTIGDVTLAVRVWRALRAGGVMRAAQVPPSNARRPVAAPVRPPLFRLFRSFGSVRFLALAGHPSLLARPRGAAASRRVLPAAPFRPLCGAGGVLRSGAVLRSARSSGRGLPRRSRATTAPEPGASVQASCGESGADALGA